MMFYVATIDIISSDSFPPVEKHSVGLFHTRELAQDMVDTTVVRLNEEIRTGILTELGAFVETDSEFIWENNCNITMSYKIHEVDVENLDVVSKMTCHDIVMGQFMPYVSIYIYWERFHSFIRWASEVDFFPDVEFNENGVKSVRDGHLKTPFKCQRLFYGKSQWYQ